MENQEKNKNRRCESFRDLMYNAPLGRFIIFGGVIAGIVLAYNLADNLISRTNSIIQKNVIHWEAPETYIERDGVKYFSHLDGMNIEELFKR